MALPWCLLQETAFIAILFPIPSSRDRQSSLFNGAAANMVVFNGDALLESSEGELLMGLHLLRLLLINGDVTKRVAHHVLLILVGPYCPLLPAIDAGIDGRWGVTLMAVGHDDGLQRPDLLLGHAPDLHDFRFLLELAAMRCCWRLLLLKNSPGKMKDAGRGEEVVAALVRSRQIRHQLFAVDFLNGSDRPSVARRQWDPCFVVGGLDGLDRSSDASPVVVLTVDAEDVIAAARTTWMLSATFEDGAVGLHSPSLCF
ncbi:hypothetical protein ACLOJK_037174 [Asimina triloba]